MMRVRTSVIGVVAVMHFATAACAQPSGPPVSDRQASDPWAGRSGQAEALSDIAAGRPIKLFYQGFAGERLEIRTPGLLNCNPDRYDVPKEARSKFEPVGADYSESIQYTPEEHARIVSANQFAKAYNLTIFHRKRDEVLRICPAATPG